jgi:ketosteroid isomerase-like protein
VTGSYDATFRAMIDAYAAGDRDAMAAALSESLVAYVTNADGGVDEVRGRDAYMARVPGGDAEYSATVTQTVSPAPDQILAMVEIRAERKGKTLHNHAGFLARFDDGERIDRFWMVDALPAYSDEFWA